MGFPPRAVMEMVDNGIPEQEATKLLDHRGAEEYSVLRRLEKGKKSGCIEAVLTLPGLKQVREVLPQGLKDRVKLEVKHVLFGDSVEP